MILTIPKQHCYSYSSSYTRTQISTCTVFGVTLGSSQLCSTNYSLYSTRLEMLLATHTILFVL
ncbi:hypothetical protein SAMN03159341_102138 [Paenibacillus sp. 1_12]|nr:hypothetical protein SAMN03159341_102138 [Paenibacillus sp. 1_12]